MQVDYNSYPSLPCNEPCRYRYSMDYDFNYLQHILDISMHCLRHITLPVGLHRAQSQLIRRTLLCRYLQQEVQNKSSPVLNRHSRNAFHQPCVNHRRSLESLDRNFCRVHKHNISRDICFAPLLHYRWFNLDQAPKILFPEELQQAAFLPTQRTFTHNCFPLHYVCEILSRI